MRSFHPLHQNARMTTAQDDRALIAWVNGATGIPFIDHVAAARAAKARLTALRQTAGYREAALEVFQKHGSRKRRIDEYHPRRGQARCAAVKQDGVQLSLLPADRTCHGTNESRTGRPVSSSS